MGKTNNFPGLKNETETETFNFGLMEPRPRPRLSFWVSWNRDRDRDFNMKSRETETFTRPDILSLGGTETGTETTKVSVPRVSAPRPPISDLPLRNTCLSMLHGAERQGGAGLQRAGALQRAFAERGMTRFSR